MMFHYKNATRNFVLWLIFMVLISIPAFEIIGFVFDGNGAMSESRRTVFREVIEEFSLQHLYNLLTDIDFFPFFLAILLIGFAGFAFLKETGKRWNFLGLMPETSSGVKVDFETKKANRGHQSPVEDQMSSQVATKEKRSGLRALAERVSSRANRKYLNARRNSESDFTGWSLPFDIQEGYSAGIPMELFSDIMLCVKTREILMEDLKNTGLSAVAEILMVTTLFEYVRSDADAVEIKYRFRVNGADIENSEVILFPSRWRFTIRTGNKIRVLYHPDNPKRVIIQRIGGHLPA